MIVYKITNKQNGAIYIGSTINTLKQRWNRHKNDALHNITNNHFAKAIRLYGPEAFETEIIDTAKSEKELIEKEYYWINYYQANKNGYNENIDGFKCGGNTYKNKTLEELNSIKEKIRQSKLGANNPHATKVKCKNIKTNEEYHFDTQFEMQQFFNETNHQFCSRRCRKEIKCLYKNEWLIAYEKDEYPINYTIKGQTKKRGTQIKVINIETQEEFIFSSIRQAKEAFYDLPSRQMISLILKGKKPQPKKYIIKNID